MCTHDSPACFFFLWSLRSSFEPSSNIEDLEPPPPFFSIPRNNWGLLLASYTRGTSTVFISTQLLKPDCCTAQTLNLFTIQWIWIVRGIHSARQEYMNFFFDIMTVNASLVDNVTFSAFFWTSEANGCFHLEMYFWLVTMVSQQIMASVCFLTHSWRRRWQSSSEKMDGKKGCKVKTIEAFKIIDLSGDFKNPSNYSAKKVKQVWKYMQNPVDHNIFYNFS